MSAHVRPREDRRLLGIGLALVGYTCFTIIDSCAKWLTQHGGLPTMEVVFIRYAAQMLLVLALFLPSRGRTLARTEKLPLELVRALALLGSTILNFLAIQFLPLTITASIMFTSPLILVALSIPLLGETVGWRRWLAILVGFVGVLIIVRPGTGAFHPAVLLSLAAASCGALYMLLTRKLAGVDSVSTQQFYVGLVSTTLMLPFALGGWVWPQDPATWFAFGLIGVAAFTGHQVITIAHRFAPASVLAPFSYVQIISMTASSWIVFNQPPEMWLFVGAPIVTASGLYIWLRERQLGKKPVVLDEGT
jgi:drug/metabolite transporter (DMT)-like permease